jgi:hypothetical protein
VDPVPDPLLLRKSGRAGNPSIYIYTHMKCAITYVTTSSVPMSDANVSLLIPEALSSYENRDRRCTRSTG